VYEAFTQGTDLQTGFNVMNLASGGVGFAVDEFNASLVTAEMKAAVDKAAADIASGALVVHDYTTDNTCPVN
jgi:basic membrane protein A